MQEVKLDPKKVLLGYSGGIDSTAATLMLRAQGYEVIGVTMKVWDSPVNDEAIQEAIDMAKKLQLEHHVADLRGTFRKQIVQYFIDEYKLGHTPNPCVMCNPLFKFHILMEWADKLGCAYVATGHYGHIVQHNQRYYIEVGEDALKDQSYFLWRLSQKQLSRILFPLADYTKPQVRAYLEEQGYGVKAKGGESMEVCFIQGDYRDFLEAQAPELAEEMPAGLFVDSKGRTMGTHKGAYKYTVGQRKGLDIALGYPAYVLKINAQRNTVMLGHSDELKAHYMIIHDLQVAQVEELKQASQDRVLTVRIRYRSKPIPCELRVMSDGRYIVHFFEEASAITPGQSAVFYINKRMLGGAFIDEQKGVQYLGDTYFLSNKKED